MLLTSSLSNPTADTANRPFKIALYADTAISIWFCLWTEFFFWESCMWFCLWTEITHFFELILFSFCYTLTFLFLFAISISLKVDNVCEWVVEERGRSFRNIPRSSHLRASAHLRPQPSPDGSAGFCLLSFFFFFFFLLLLLWFD